MPVKDRAVATSSEALERNEAAEVAQIRQRVAAGEMTMRDAQLQLVEMILHRTADFPRHIQERLRATLMEVVETDPYFQLECEVAPED